LKKSTLSLCMIVKNEERFLRDCLESVKDVVDQIVIVDTGSADLTVDIAKEYGAEIYHFPWCHDFSAARNESLKYATCDWIMWMDADERLAPESTGHFLRILASEKLPVVYKVNIHSIWKDKSTIQLSSAHRIFNNYKGIYFSGKIHEQIASSASAVNAEERDSNIVIHHLGYGLDVESIKKKNRRNRELLVQMVKESPDSAYAHYTLAQHYSMTDEPEKALNHYEKAYRLNQFDAPMTASLLNTMAESHVKLGHYDIAKALCKISVKMIPIQVGGYYLLYKIANKQNNYRDAITCLKKLNEQNKDVKLSEKRISTDILIDEDRILYTIGFNYLESGDLKKAVTYYEKVYRNKKENTGLLEEMVSIYLRLKDFTKAEWLLKTLVRVKKEDLQYQDLLGIVLIKQKKFQDAVTVYESMIRKDPNNNKILRRLIGLYGKIGCVSEAKEILSSGAMPISAKYNHS
jgi:glycosyltransferase involved in cell wall biosynthesis